MGDAADHAVYYRAVSRVTGENLLPRLVDYIVAHKSRLDTEQVQKLQRALAGEVKGFRDWSRIPSAILRKQLQKLAARDEELALLLFYTWTRLRSDLINQLRSSGADTPDYQAGAEELSNGTRREDTDAADVTAEDLKLARIALDVERHHLSSVELPESYRLFLEQLEKLPADASEWDTEILQTFKARLDHLIAQKRAEADGRRAREALSRRLDEMRRAWADAGLAWDRWSADSCPLDKVEQVTETLTELEQLLEERARLLERARQVSMADQVRVYAELQTTVSKIASLQDTLQELLEPGTQASETADKSRGDNTAEEDSRITPSAVAPADTGPGLRSKSEMENGQQTGVEAPPSLTEQREDRPETATQRAGGAQTTDRLPGRSEAAGTEPSAAPPTPAKTDAVDGASADGAAEPSTVAATELPPVRARDGMVDSEMPNTGEPAPAEAAPPSLPAVTAPPDAASPRPADSESIPVTTGLAPAGALWHLVARLDLDGAYWLAAALEKSGQSSRIPVIPAELLRALVGSRWLPGEPRLVGDVGEALGLAAQQLATADTASAPIRALFAAACLVTALKAPATGAGSLLEPLPAPFESFNPLIESIRSFAARFQDTLRPEDLGVALEEHEAERRIAELSATAREKLEEAPKRRLTNNYVPASLVFWHLTREDAEASDNLIYQAWAPVAADRREDADKVHRFVRRYSSRSYLQSLLERLQGQVVQGGHTVERLEGWAMSRLIREIEEALRLADEWAALVRQIETKGADDSRRTMVQQLVREVTPQIDVALAACDDLQELVLPRDGNLSQYLYRSTAARVLRESVAGVRCLLTGRDPDYGPVPPWVRDGLDAALQFRLLAYPELEWQADNGGRPKPPETTWEPLVEILTEEAESRLGRESAGNTEGRGAQSVGAASPPSAETVEESGAASGPGVASGSESENPATTAEPRATAPAADRDAYLARLARRWLALEDLRWVEDLIAAVQSETERSALEYELEIVRRGSLAELEKKVPILEGYVEQAAVQGTLDPTARSAMRTELHELSMELKGGKVRIPLLRDRLNAIEQELKEYADRALRERQETWEKLAPRLRGVLDEEDNAGLSRAADTAFARHNLAIIDELIAHARRALEQGSAEPIRQLLDHMPSSTGTELFEAFLQCRDTLRTQLERKPLDLIAKDFRMQKRPQLLEKQRLPKEELEELALVFASWHALKEDRYGDEQRNLRLYNVLRYLGFHVEEPRAMRRREVGRDWELWEAAVNVSSPVPEYGSEAGGRIRVLLASGKGGSGSIANILRAAGLTPAEPALVLWFRMMSDEEFKELARWAKRASAKVIVVDEILLAFLARQRSNRLHALLRCTLPATAVNPYRPDAGVNLAREMFFGRESLVADLADINGPTYVYGGRKLGKSSLLARVASECHHPEKKRFAIRDELWNVGRPDHVFTEPEYVWTRIAQQMRAIPELKFRSAARKPRNIVEAIRTYFRDNPDVRLTVLLDEADEFLAADAARKFPNVGLLNQLMTETGRRFRVIFAGVHSVRRFRHIPNQPLVGRAAVVGPLEPRAAARVITEPMAILGYAMEDTAVLRILSAVNYHPMLLQALCHTLVAWLNRREIMPPYVVTLADVEEVLRQPDVQNLIKDRFLLTLALDSHYGVLVRALVYDQWEQPNGFSRAYSLREIRELAGTWWKDEFARLTPERMRGYLEELKDMGVLVEAEPGRYRVHSPNLVRLLGTQQEIEDALLSVDKEGTVDASPSDWAAADRIQPKLVAHGRAVYSPLTVGQLRLLWTERSDVTLIAGSAATGIGHVASTLQALSHLRGDFQFHHAEHVRDVLGILDGDLAMAGGSHPAGSAPVGRAEGGDATVVGLTLHARSPEELRDDVRTIIDRIKELSGRHGRGWVHVVALLDPDGIDQWIRLPAKERLDLEHATAMTCLRPWHESALIELLDEEEIPRTGHGELYDVTSGYYLLWEEARTRLARGLSPGDAARELEAELFEGKGSLRETFLAAAGLHRDTFLWKLMKWIAAWVHSPSRSEDYHALVHVVAEELGIEEARVAANIDALAYRGLVVTDRQTLTIPLVPYRLFADGDE